MARKTTSVARRSRLGHTSRSNARSQAVKRAAPLLLPREAGRLRRTEATGEVNQERIARAVREIIIAIGETPIGKDYATPPLALLGPMQSSPPGCTSIHAPACRPFST